MINWSKLLPWRENYCDTARREDAAVVLTAVDVCSVMSWIHEFTQGSKVAANVITMLSDCC